MSDKNLHLTHLEDLIFTDDIEGTRKAIFFLKDLRKMLAGNSKPGNTISLKFDGCIHEDSILFTTIGDMKIKDFIDAWKKNPNIKVMGKREAGYDAFVDVLASRVDDGEKPWVEIELVDGSILKMTEDHEVHTSNRGWVKAGDLTSEDDITEL